MKGVTIYLADGFEDVEAIGTRDVLTRGGISVRTVSIGKGRTVTSSHGLEVTSDLTLEDLKEEGGESSRDVMIFPGGMPGTKNLAVCSRLIGMMNRHYASGGTLAAICAAPGFVLSQLDGFEGTRFAGFPGCEQAVVEAGGLYCDEGVVACGRIITGRSAGHSLEFGLTILRFLAGPAAESKVRDGLFPPAAR